MFTSSGYFRGVTCPYYASGLCERPYCHFRHVKPTTPGAREHASPRTAGDPGSDSVPDDGALSDSTTGSSQSSSLLSMVGQAIKQVQRDIERDKASLSSIKSVPGSNVSSTLYKPTPIASTSGQSSGPGGLYGTRTTVPEYEPLKPQHLKAQYKPTPIKLLNKQKQANSSKNAALYVIETQDHINDNEYDPAVNFSTRVKGVKRPATETTASPQVKKSKVMENDEGDVAVFSDDEGTEDAVSEQPDIPAYEPQTKLVKNELEVKKAAGVFTMDVDAILGVPVTKTQKEASHRKRHVSKSREVQKDKSSTSCSDKKHPKVSTNKGASNNSSSAKKSSTVNSNKEGKNNSTHDRRKEKTSSDKKYSNSVSKVKIEPGQVDKEQTKEKSVRKEDQSKDQRNIFNILKDAMSENSNDSLNFANSMNVEKSPESNKENKSEDRSLKQTADKTSEKGSTSRSDRSSSHHRTHSDRDDKSQSDKKQKSSNSSRHHKTESSHKHSSSSSSSSKRHRTSSGSSSSSSRHKKTSSSSSSHHRSSSKDKHHSSSKSHSSSNNSSSRGSSHPSSSKDRNHKLSQSRQRSHDRDSPKKSAGRKPDVKEASSKSRTQRLFSNVDLFGEDSDDGSDDVMIVEPPKVDIPVVELSSEEEEEEETSDNSVENTSTAPTPSNKKIHEENEDIPEVGFMSDDDSDSDNDQDSVPNEDLASLEANLETEDTYDECLRIFNEESSRSAKTNLQPKAKVPEPEEEEDPAPFLGKKRVARITEKEAAITRKAPPIPKAGVRQSPSQVMHNRFLAIQKAAEEAVKRNDDPLAKKARIAHKPEMSVIKSDQPSNNKNTPISTVPKDITSQPTKRTAHVPNKAVVKRPTIPADYGSKVATSIRQRYLNLFIDEALKVYHNEKDAFDRALEEEKVVYSRSTSKNIYLNVAVNCIKKLRAEASGGKGEKKVTPNKTGPKQFSHQALLGGKMAAKTSFTVKRSATSIKEPKTFSAADLYTELKKYVLSPEQLVENGFPSMSEDRPGTAIIRTDEFSKKTARTATGNERLCVRCGKRFLLDSDQNYMYNEECIYHWGKLWKRKIGNSIENRYTCCQEDANASGCGISKGHVHDQNKYENLSGYMQTLPASPPIDGNYGVYALDCEMVYTTGGIELARITVINPQLKPVYEQIVLPEKPIIDPNTRFSGLTEEDFVGVTTTIRDIQAVLLSMFNAETILIGHSLESDLTALKLVHHTVVDTSVVFPHRLGPPYKRALRTLMAEILQKIIQDNVGGHDSQEDAVAAMELMLWKIKEDAKKVSRR